MADTVEVADGVGEEHAEGETKVAEFVDYHGNLIDGGGCGYKEFFNQCCSVVVDNGLKLMAWEAVVVALAVAGGLLTA